MKSPRTTLWFAVTLVVAVAAAPAAADQVILDDLIVDGSACIGLDCVNGESFGFDTIRLKENNLRIRFDDTSSSASFPANDWQITINESSNGGLSKFSIDDLTGSRTPFTIEAGAPSNSLYVENSGELGIGTTNPVADVHIVEGDTPTLRLEQDGSSGFTPQTWDVAGNETNFFIRDVTNGSTLPFRIRPSAPTSAIDVEGTTGDVGFGTASPDSAIHVLDNGGNGAVQLRLENNGSVRFELENSDDSETWVFRNSGCASPVTMLPRNCFRINPTGAGSDVALQLTQDGDLFVAGTVNPGSSRSIKQDFAEIDPDQMLDLVSQLEISEWTYKRDRAKARHIGPMAEDFWAAFGVGAGDKTLSPSDSAGVALAAIQGLNRKVEEKDAELAALKERLDALEALLTAQSQQ